ncbi:MAG: zinc-binding dehydrogenase [Saprospiraceae bacterium]|jgi:NADPH:quinone reductase-like Zn-dependent oxidoreductase|nr:zinc-binding dehydrogenase [Saprospiraceae bacterium]
MKAIFLIKYGDAKQSFEIRDIQPVPPKPDEVMIKVKYSGLNFADVIARRGLYPDAPANPALLGYDVSGEVVEAGSNVKEFSIGQKVVAMTRFGGYAEYVTTNINGVAAIPDGMNMAEATVLATQACTAYYCAEDCTTLHRGERVLIQAAAGGVGGLLVQIAKHRGCIIYGTASTGKQDYLRQAGVDYPIDYTKDDFYKRIKESGAQIDVVFDSIGGTVFKKGMKLLAPGGKMICYGAAEQMESTKNKLKLISMLWGFGLFSPISLLMQSKSVITVNMLRIADFKPVVFKDILTNVVIMANEGIIQPQVSKIFPYTEMAAAHEYLESRKSIGKVVVEW